jgi:integration host factor subunit alpha
VSLRKIDIIESIYEEFDISKKDCFRIVDSLFEIIKDELNKGNTVKISGFGRWTVRSKKELKGWNLQIGKEIMIDARKVVKFKPSDVLRKRLI